MAIPRWCWLIVSLAAGACSLQRFNRQFNEAEKDFNDHIGFVLYDPVKHKTIYDHQGDRYFTPASNTKILTLLASLHVLRDSMPSLRYVERNDSLIFWGTGDPGFLYANANTGTSVYNFLSSYPAQLYFSPNNFQTNYFGPGWCWDDYNDTDQIERTSLPIYGNRVSVRKIDEEFISRPPVFEYSIDRAPVMNDKAELVRDQFKQSYL